MAKSFLNIFRESNETQYPELGLSLSMIGLQNTLSWSPPALSGNGALKGKGKYEIQRPIRNLAVDAADSFDATTGVGKAFTDTITDLDGFHKETWETVEIATGVKRIIGLNVQYNEQFDMEDARDFAKPIAGFARNRAIESEEKALATLVGTTGVTVKTSTLDIKDPTKYDLIAAEILDEVDAIHNLNDKFKTYSDKVVVLVHPTIARAFSDIQGKEYQTGKDTFTDSFGRHAFVYKDVTFVANKYLNSLSDGTDIVGAVILDTEAFLTIPASDTFQVIDEKFANKRYTGAEWYDTSGVIDTDRIVVIKHPSAIAKSKLVNEK